jgi:uncharacterized 2Fe-2S/4Fe-4S cluster protein (DUF4445 family)
VKGLRPEEAARGFRLACQVRARGDLLIEIPPGSRSFWEQILTSTQQPAGRLKVRPNVQAHYLELPTPSLSDQADDLERLARGLNLDHSKLEAGPAQLRELSAALRAGNFKVTATLCGPRLLCAEPGDTRGRCYGLAYDLGTTTVVGYLLDLATGRDLALAARSNPQAAYGEDVLSRTDYAARGEREQRELQALIIGCFQDIAAECAQKAGVPLERCFEVVFCGNTIMTHLALATDPRHIACVPFTPIWTRSLELSAGELGLKLHHQARAYCLPCVAGYVGGDITGGIIAADLERRQGATLFVDIGTNCEIVLGARDGLLACSSPAGPAFEGARISCGLRAEEGAIDRVSFDAAAGDLKLHSLRGVPPRGLCGTGLVDAVALFLELGLVASDGQIVAPDRAAASLPPNLAARVRRGQNGSEILLVPKEQTLDQRRDLTLTQRDVRELQLAKGALRAGVDMALKLKGVTGAELDRVLIAGGFGNFINPASARRIGLFPPAIRLEQLEFVGNSAAAGARLCLLDTHQRSRVEKLARSIKYVELSGRPDFQEAFADAMQFPEAETRA